MSSRHLEGGQLVGRQTLRDYGFEIEICEEVREAQSKSAKSRNPEIEVMVVEDSTPRACATGARRR